MPGPVPATLDETPPGGLDPVPFSDPEPDADDLAADESVAAGLALADGDPDADTDAAVLGLADVAG